MPQAIRQKQTSLLNFFPSPTASHTSPKSSPLSSSSPVPGLSLHPNFISASLESFILKYLDSQSWRTDLSRRTMHFGGTYCLMPVRGSDPTVKPEILTAPPIPQEFDELMKLFIKEGIYKSNNLPECCIVNEYRENQGISAHVENFTFDSPVVALSLLDTCPMTFHELSEKNDGSVRSGKAKLAKRTGKKAEVMLEGRSVMVMRGEAREKWQHEILKNRKGRIGESGEDGKWRRVSLTFRVKKVR